MSQIQLKIIRQLMLLTMMVVFISCQEEYTETVEPDKSVTISASDHLADLILKVVLKDGSYDNIIDRSSEISIIHPYSVTIDKELFYVGTLKDIDVLTLQYFNKRGDIEINYPVSITYSNYSESFLSNKDELEDIQERYNISILDDDIECVDFIYPIELSLYKNLNQSIEEITVHNDREMYNVFVNIQDFIVDINFPIELVSIDGASVVITNNDQLEREIKNKRGSCNELDKVEFEDKDYPYEELISRQDWIVSYYADPTDVSSQFNDYTFAFRKDNTIQASKESEIIEGEWELELIDTLKILHMRVDTDATPLVWMNDDWGIIQANSATIELMTKVDKDVSHKHLILSKNR